MRIVRRKRAADRDERQHQNAQPNAQHGSAAD
jgi:hypothetical protein